MADFGSPSMAFQGHIHRPPTVTGLSEAFDRAVSFARNLHASQRRKVSGAPYLCHLLEVSGLVLSHGGDETQAVAALLHDSVEDQSSAFGGSARLREAIASEFGPSVLHLVDLCSDCEGEPKPPWAERKRQHIQRLRGCSAYECLVPACDKLYNVRCINSELRAGRDPFSSLKAGLAEQLWHLSALADLFERKSVPVVPDLRFEIARLREEFKVTGGSRSVRGSGLAAAMGQ